MNFLIPVPLQADSAQHARLGALQALFSQACNALAPLAQQTGIWNRVTLHHLAYKKLREQFPGLGSQMICNVIYSVSRTCRQVYQHPASPAHPAKAGSRPLPLIRFGDNCPVYFDRHTLSLKAGQLSLYTQEGRLRFQIALDPRVESCFHEKKLREIALMRGPDDGFMLNFLLADDLGQSSTAEPEGPTLPPYHATVGLPAYVMVEENA